MSYEKKLSTTELTTGITVKAIKKNMNGTSMI